MLAIALVALITIGCVAQFYLKNNPLTSFVTAVSAFLGMVLAFNFYELPGGMLIEKNIMPAEVSGLCFLLIFGLSFGLFRTICGFLVGSKIEFGILAKSVSAIIFGLITGIIISGCSLIAINMRGSSSKISYKRFDDTITQQSVLKPSKCIIPADDIVAGIFAMVSKGSLSSKKSFAVYHADFIDKLCLSKQLTKDKIPPVTGSKAISVPKLGVREAETSDGDSYTAVRVEINTSKIDKGGAANKDGKFSFGLYQFRMICKPAGERNTKGSASAVIYPTPNVVFYQADGRAQKKNLSEEYGKPITFEKEQVFKGKGIIDLAFEIPSGMEGFLLEFKNTAVVEVPKITTAEDAEEQINAIFKSEN